jgi:hypothetical protein
VPGDGDEPAFDIVETVGPDGMNAQTEIQLGGRGCNPPTIVRSCDPRVGGGCIQRRR